MISKVVFRERISALTREHQKLTAMKNEPVKANNGVFIRYKNPVVTADHTPLFWRYDYDYKANPYFMERLGINCTFNPGAIELNGKI